MGRDKPLRLAGDVTMKILTLGILSIAAAITALACASIGLGGGACHDKTTGEILEQVEDARGELHSVGRGVTMELGSLEETNCSVSIEASVFDGGFWGDYVLHPATGNRIEVNGPSRGEWWLASYLYEWY